MEIRRLELLEGAAAATGLTVVIDVFRAFSTAAYVLANGAREILAVGAIEQAYELKQRNPDFVLMGERGGRIQPGFDLGNSPYDASRYDFSGRTAILTTGAGTQGLTSAVGAQELVAGSFPTAAATARYIRSRSPQVVSLVAMGNRGVVPNDEDRLFAGYLAGLLEGHRENFEEIVRTLRQSPSGRRFFDPAVDWALPEDFELALSLDRFSFCLTAEALPDGTARITKAPDPLMI